MSQTPLRSAAHAGRVIDIGTLLMHMGASCGLYACAALTCVHQLAGSNGDVLPSPRALAIVFLTTTAIYAIDRVKLRGSAFDPADVVAEPERYAFLKDCRRLVRLIALTLGSGAMWLASAHGFAGPFAVAVAIAGGILYAPGARRERPRIKDVLWLKNSFTALGLAGFVGYFAATADPATAGPSHLWVAIACAALLLAFRVFLDAALCDLDDERSDRVFQTRTLCTVFGGRRVWRYTGLARVALIAATLLALPLSGTGRIVWAAAMICGMAALRVRKPARVRGLVDLRFVWEAGVATLLLVLARVTTG